METTKVTYLRLHEGLYVQGPGNLGDVFPTIEKGIQNLDMSTSTAGVIVKGSRLGKAFKFLVPYANIKVACLDTSN
jgi:hypothetical protein